MKGRGVRVINPTDLQGVTPDATVKDHFVIGTANAGEVSVVELTISSGAMLRIEASALSIDLIRALIVVRWTLLMPHRTDASRLIVLTPFSRTLSVYGDGFPTERTRFADLAHVPHYPRQACRRRWVRSQPKRQPVVFLAAERG